MIMGVPSLNSEVGEVSFGGILYWAVVVVVWMDGLNG